MDSLIYSIVFIFIFNQVGLIPLTAKHQQHLDLSVRHMFLLSLSTFSPIPQLLTTFRFIDDTIQFRENISTDFCSFQISLNQPQLKYFLPLRVGADIYRFNLKWSSIHCDSPICLSISKFLHSVCMESPTIVSNVFVFSLYFGYV